MKDELLQWPEKHENKKNKSREIDWREWKCMFMSASSHRKIAPRVVQYMQQNKLNNRHNYGSFKATASAGHRKKA